MQLAVPYYAQIYLMIKPNAYDSLEHVPFSRKFLKAVYIGTRIQSIGVFLSRS